jgi:hypothetical protein
MRLRWRNLCEIVALRTPVRPFSVLAFLIAALASGAEAPSAAITENPSDSSANSALAWWRAFDAMPKEDHPVMKLAALEKCRLPDPVADAFFEQQSISLDLLALGAACPYCDWGISPQKEGPSAPLLYTYHLQPLIRLGILRARWHMVRHEPGLAVDDLVACLRAARLMSGRHPLVIDYAKCSWLEGMIIDKTGGIVSQLPGELRHQLVIRLSNLPNSVRAAEISEQELANDLSIVRKVFGTPPKERAGFASLIDKLQGTSAKSGDALVLTDDLMLKVQSVLPDEFKRGKEHLLLSPMERLKPLVPAFTQDDPSMLKVLKMLTPSWTQIAAVEVRLLQKRQQLLAAIAYLDGAKDNLGLFPDVLTSAPFQLEQTAYGFRLFSDAQGQDARVELKVGELPFSDATSSPSGSRPEDHYKPGVADF